MASYVALIHKDPASDYGISFPDLPGCVSAAPDLDAARAGAAEALAFHIAGLREDGDPIPTPSSLEAVMADAVNHDGVAILIDEAPAGRSIVPIDLTPSELREIDGRAARLGMTRSAFLADAARRALDLQVEGAAS